MDLFGINGVQLLSWLSVAAGLGWLIWRYGFQRCEKCGARFRLEKERDSMGWNVSKKVTFSLWNGPRFITETWACESCDHKQTVKYFVLK